RHVPVQERKRHGGPGIMLPDKLQHQQLVEIGVEQGSRDRVQFPVVVMRPLRKVHNHQANSLGGDRASSPGQTGGTPVLHQCALCKSSAALLMPAATFSIACATWGICASASFHFFSSRYSRTAAIGLAP